MWIILIIVLGVVVALALWLGRGFSIKKGDEGLEVKVEGAGATSSGTADESISVASGATISGSVVGDITGVKVTGKNNISDNKEKIDVLNGGAVKDSTVGDIAGKKSEE